MSELTLQAARRIGPRRTAIALAAAWLVFAGLGIMVDRGHGAQALRAFNLAESDFGHHLGVPAGFTAVLMLLAAGMALALARVDRTRRERIWRLAGWALLVLALDHLLGIHKWLETRGVSWNASYLPLLALTTFALLRALRVLKSQLAVQALFGAAIVLWLAGGALGNPALVSANAGAEILAMAAAALFALALLIRLRYLAAQYYPLEEPETRLSVDQIAAEVLDRVAFRPIAIALIVGAAAFAIQDLFLHTGDYTGHRAPILDVGAEQSLWAMLQGALFFSVALLSILIGRLRATPPGLRLGWLVLGTVLVVLGLDEIAAVHDRLQDTVGSPAQLGLIPVAVVGIVAWVIARHATPANPRVRRLALAGVLLWFAAQAIDLAIHSGAHWTIVPAEVMETLAATCWLFALGYALREVLPVGVFPLEPVAGMLTGKTTITQLPEAERSAGTPTG